MKRLRRAGLLALALAVLILLCGSLLPATHTECLQLELPGSPESVFTLLTDYEHASTWRPGIVRVERAGEHDGHLLLREWVSEKTSRVVEVVESSAPARLVTRSSDAQALFQGTSELTLTSVGAGTRLRVALSASTGNPVGRLLARFPGFLTWSARRNLAALALRLGTKAAATACPGE